MCSYHAFNLCDGAGVHAKRVAVDLSKLGTILLTGRDFACAFNQSSYLSDVCIPFDSINRSTDTFPAVAVIGRPITDTYGDKYSQKWPLKKYCELQYWYEDEEKKIVREPGYIRASLRSGTSEYYLMDLLPQRKAEPEPTSVFCGRCSTKAQRPCRCVPKECPFIKAQARGPVSLPINRSDFPFPHSSRKGTGFQFTRTHKKDKARGIGQFPCPLQKCPKKFYQKEHHLRTHLTRSAKKCELHKRALEAYESTAATTSTTTATTSTCTTTATSTTTNSAFTTSTTKAATSASGKRKKRKRSDTESSDHESDSSGSDYCRQLEAAQGYDQRQSEISQIEVDAPLTGEQKEEKKMCHTRKVAPQQRYSKGSSVAVHCCDMAAKEE